MADKQNSSDRDVQEQNKAFADMGSDDRPADARYPSDVRYPTEGKRADNYSRKTAGSRR